MAVNSTRATANDFSRQALGGRNFRVGGSGFTAFHWENRPIAFARNLVVQSAQPVAPPSAIQPLDAPYPLEIITPAAVGPISLQVQAFELYRNKVWDDIMRTTDSAHAGGVNRLSTYKDLREVFVRLSNVGRGVQVTKYVFPPNKIQNGLRNQYYAETYSNVRIVDIRDDENIEIGTMEMIKSISMLATRSNRVSHNS